MPQMSPYNWLYLNLFFLSIFIFMMILMYYFYINKFIFIKNIKLKNHYIMKW